MSQTVLYLKLATYFYFWKWSYQINSELIFFVPAGEKSLLWGKSMKESLVVV